MKCMDLIEELQRLSPVRHDPAKTNDTVKAGDPNTEIRKIAVSMFATPEVVRQTIAMGANFLIVHEPTYYNYAGGADAGEPGQRKQEMLEQSGLVVYRFHDHAHTMEPDLICEGELKYLDLPGHFQRGKYFAVNNFVLDREMTTRELVYIIENRLGLRHVRVAGNMEAKGTKISCCFGTPGHLQEELEENDFVLTGEICEWAIGEYARDGGQFGRNKAIIVMGHIGSERAGMMLLADKIKEMHPQIDTAYIECGELYQYAD